MKIIELLKIILKMFQKKEKMKDKLSTHFTLKEMIRSQTAERQGIDNTPNDAVYSNLVALCENVLESIRIKYNKPIFVSSGYRCPALNLSIGSNNRSQHIKGEAADFVVNNIPVQDVWEWVCKESNINFDQVIWEFNSWIHISFKADGENRNKCSIAYKQNKKTVYKHYTRDEILNDKFFNPFSE